MKVVRFEFALFGINTYVVYDPETKDCAIIDPGMSSQEETDALDNFIERENLNVTHLINTHLHIDHAIADHYVSKKYGVTVEAHSADGALGERLRQQAQMFGLTEAAEGLTISHFITDGDVIKIGKGSLIALHIPGHSPGSIVLYDKADGFVIAGDVLFNNSIGRTDLPGGSMTELLTGIRQKLLPLPPQTVVYPGHGPATTIGEERKNNPFLK